MAEVWPAKVRQAAAGLRYSQYAANVLRVLNRRCTPIRVARRESGSACRVACGAQIGLADAVCAMRALRIEYNAQKAALFARQSRGTSSGGAADAAVDFMNGQRRAPELVAALADADARFNGLGRAFVEYLGMTLRR